MSIEVILSTEYGQVNRIQSKLFDILLKVYYSVKTEPNMPHILRVCRCRFSQSSKNGVLRLRVQRGRKRSSAPGHNKGKLYVFCQYWLDCRVSLRLPRKDGFLIVVARGSATRQSSIYNTLFSSDSVARVGAAACRMASRLRLVGG